MPSKKQQLTITSDQAGKRLDVFLSEHLTCSRSQVQKLIRQHLIRINEIAPSKTGVVLSQGDKIYIQQMPEQKDEMHIVPAEVKGMDFAVEPEVVEMTDEYLVVYKPAHMLVHPTQAQETGTLAHWIVQKFPEIAKVGESKMRPGIVHRIDKDVSGILVVARTQKMFDHLKAQFKNRTIEKGYRALVHGLIEADDDTIVFPIDRGVDGKMVARPIHEEVTLRNVNKILPGKDAITHIHVLHRYARYTLLDIEIETGRTHQIRVHLFAYGHPVVGDTLYSQKRFVKKHDPHIDRILLHAYTLCFTDREGNRVCVTKDLPTEFQKFLDHIV